MLLPRLELRNIPYAQRSPQDIDNISKLEHLDEDDSSEGNGTYEYLRQRYGIDRKNSAAQVGTTGEEWPGLCQMRVHESAQFKGPRGFADYRGR